MKTFKSVVLGVVAAVMLFFGVGVMAGGDPKPKLSIEAVPHDCERLQKGRQCTIVIEVNGEWHAHPNPNGGFVSVIGRSKNGIIKPTTGTIESKEQLSRGNRLFFEVKAHGDGNDTIEFRSPSDFYDVEGDAVALVSKPAKVRANSVAEATDKVAGHHLSVREVDAGGNGIAFRVDVLHIGDKDNELSQRGARVGWTRPPGIAKTKGTSFQHSMGDHTHFFGKVFEAADYAEGIHAFDYKGAKVSIVIGEPAAEREEETEGMASIDSAPAPVVSSVDCSLDKTLFLSSDIEDANGNSNKNTLTCTAKTDNPTSAEHIEIGYWSQNIVNMFVVVADPRDPTSKKNGDGFVVETTRIFDVTHNTFDIGEYWVQGQSGGIDGERLSFVVIKRKGEIKYVPDQLFDDGSGKMRLLVSLDPIPSEVIEVIASVGDGDISIVGAVDDKISYGINAQNKFGVLEVKPKEGPKPFPYEDLGSILLEIADGDKYKYQAETESVPVRGPIPPPCAEVDAASETGDCLVSDITTTSVEQRGTLWDESHISLRTARVVRKKGWKYSIAFTCLAPKGSACTSPPSPAPIDPTVNPGWIPDDQWDIPEMKTYYAAYVAKQNETIERDREANSLAVRCPSVNLIDTDSIDGGKSVSVSGGDDWTAERADYIDCEARSSAPFTLRVITTRPIIGCDDLPKACFD